MAGWIAFAAVNFELMHYIKFDSAFIFPISILKLEFHPDGLKYAFCFALVLYLTLKYLPRLNAVSLWLIGICLIFSGNLAQGNFDKGFIGPFVNSGQQYFYDAVKIVSGRQWLTTFNELQPQLTQHSQTHPPFAVLLHFVFFAAGGSQVAPLSIGFTLLASLSILLWYHILKLLEVPKPRRNWLTLLFIVIPAINIYTGVCLDGVILTTSLLFLYGLVRIIRSRADFAGMLCFAVGLLSTNFLTFGGTFLLAVAGIVALREFLRKKNLGLLLVLAGTLLIGIFLGIGLNVIFHYDHLKAFMTASRLENPHGFMAFADPLNYLMTRIEDVAEIALFFSFGCLAVLLHPEILLSKRIDFTDDVVSVATVGLAVLGLMFLMGTYKTGETARACLFIFPYILFLFRNVEENILERLVLMAGAQTVLMQLFGNYFW